MPAPPRRYPAALLRGDMASAVRDAQPDVRQSVLFPAFERDGYPSAPRCELEGIRKQVVIDPFQFLLVSIDTEIGSGVGIETELDGASCGRHFERLAPLPAAGGQVDPPGVQFELTVFVFAEIENLFGHPQQNPGVAADHLQIEPLLFRQPFAGGQPFDRIGDKRQRRAQVVGDVREEDQLGLGRLFELPRESHQLVALLFEPVLLAVDFVVAADQNPVEAALDPQRPAEQRGDDGDQEQAHQAEPRNGPLCGVSQQIAVGQ